MVPTEVCLKATETLRDRKRTEDPLVAPPGIRDKTTDPTLADSTTNLEPRPQAPESLNPRTYSAVERTLTQSPKTPQE